MFELPANADLNMFKKWLDVRFPTTLPENRAFNQAAMTVIRWLDSCREAAANNSTSYLGAGSVIIDAISSGDDGYYKFKLVALDRQGNFIHV